MKKMSCNVIGESLVGRHPPRPPSPIHSVATPGHGGRRGFEVLRHFIPGVIMNRTALRHQPCTFVLSKPPGVVSVCVGIGEKHTCVATLETDLPVEVNVSRRAGRDQTSLTVV